MNRNCYLVLITAAYIGVASANQLPDVTNITNLSTMANSVDLGEIAGIAASVDSLAMQGSQGSIPRIDPVIDPNIISSFKNANGGISMNSLQNKKWNIMDEYGYFLKADLNLSNLIDCMDYSLVGSCLSVRWTWKGPKFTFGFAVEHFVRDVHVEVVPQAPTESILEQKQSSVLPSSNSIAEDAIMVYPYTWKISRQIGSGILLNGIDKILEDAEGQTVRSRNNKFLYSDVQVSGNIERHLFDSVANSTVGMFGYCSSPTLPGMVYFNSTLDQFSWRWLATSETILTAAWQLKYSAWNDIGRGYGSTFPRSGYMIHNNRFQSSVISAIRATNISAENRTMFSGAAGLHVFNPLPQYAVRSFTEADYQTPQDAKSFKLSMIYPTEGPMCTRYGSDEGYSALQSISTQLAEEQLLKEFTSGNPQNTAAFKLYRPFRCCPKNGRKVFSFVSPGKIGRPK
ncbi:hypothetical protein DDN60_12760 [Vibrio cholerae]|nr:hypothetical protein [Vibrio cholerae]